MYEGSALLFTDSQGRRGIVCEPGCEGPRGGLLAGGGAGRVPFREEEGEDPGHVERSLYQRASGYNYEAVKVFMPAGHVFRPNTIGSSLMRENSPRLPEQLELDLDSRWRAQTAPSSDCAVLPRVLLQDVAPGRSL
jgi:hypothetical protein